MNSAHHAATSSSAGRNQQEVSFADLWQVLVRRKWIVLITVLIAVSIAWLQSWRAVPLYESTAIVQIGQTYWLGAVEQATVIEDPSGLTVRIKEQYGKVPGRRFPQIISAEPVTRKIENKIVDSANMLTVTARDVTSQGAESHLRSVLDRVVSEHAGILNAILKVNEDRYNSLTKRIQETRAQVDILTRSIHSSNVRPEAVGVLVLEKANLLKAITEDEAAASRLQLSIIKSKFRTTDYVSTPTTPAQPVKNKSGKNIAVGAIVGLLLGLLVAFVAESVARIRQRASV